MEIYIISLQQTLSFPSRFRRLEINNFLRRSTMVADNITYLAAPTPRIFFISTAWLGSN